MINWIIQGADKPRYRVMLSPFHPDDIGINYVMMCMPVTMVRTPQGVYLAWRIK